MLPKPIVKLFLIDLINFIADGEYLVTMGIICEEITGLVFKNDFLIFLRNEGEYPLVTRTEKSVLVADIKSE